MSESKKEQLKRLQYLRKATRRDLMEYINSLCSLIEDVEDKRGEFLVEAKSGLRMVSRRVKELEGLVEEYERHLTRERI